jgi:arylsulfatase A-like enzyme
LRAAIAVALLALPLLGRAADAPRPNVLMIALDDLNHWVGYLGRNPQTITPNIDRLAKRGVRFTRSYCAAPVCNPSRAALMTGMRPSTTGVYENNDDWRPHVSEDLPLTSTFRKAGYYVAGAGKIYHEAYGRRTEWDDYLESPGKDPEPTGNTGVGGIRFAPLDCDDDDLREAKIVGYGVEQLKKKHDKPFLLTIGLHKPHMPWNVPRKYFDMHPLDKIELPKHLEGDLTDIPPAGVAMAKPNGDHRAMLESGRWKEAVQAYLAAISYADAMVGRLLDALDASEHKDNTIVVLWGDHGWHLGEKQHWRKFALWEEATRAPADLGRSGHDAAEPSVRAHGRLHEHLSDAHRSLRHRQAGAHRRREHQVAAGRSQGGLGYARAHHARTQEPRGSQRRLALHSLCGWRRGAVRRDERSLRVDESRRETRARATDRRTGQVPAQARRAGHFRRRRQEARRRFRQGS